MATLLFDDVDAREGAVARLIVIGARAVERLIAVANSGAPAQARAAAFHALEAIADRRSLEPALRALDANDPVVTSAAISAVRPFLGGAQGAAGLDRLAGVALDAARPERIRLEAMRALAELTSSTLDPLWSRLAQDASPPVRAYAATRPKKRGRGASAARSGAARVAADEDLHSDDPAAVRASLARLGPHAALTTLHRLLERIRDREARDLKRRAEWITTRGAVHAALARRGSRLALYDLRESLESATGPLPVEFLAAAADVGDASCLEAVAAAWTRATSAGLGERDWWPTHLAETFRVIARREHLSPRHAVMKKIAKRHPGLVGTR